MGSTNDVGLGFMHHHALVRVAHNRYFDQTIKLTNNVKMSYNGQSIDYGPHVPERDGA